MSTFFDFLLCNLALDHPNIRVASGFDEKIDNKKGYVPITCCMGRPSASCKQREIFTSRP